MCAQTTEHGAIYYDGSGRNMRMRIDTLDVSFGGGPSLEGAAQAPSIDLSDWSPEQRRRLAASAPSDEALSAAGADPFARHAAGSVRRALNFISFPPPPPGGGGVPPFPGVGPGGGGSFTFDINGAWLYASGINKNFTWMLEDISTCTCSDPDPEWEFPQLTMPACAPQGNITGLADITSTDCPEGVQGCTQAWTFSLDMGTGPAGLSIDTTFALDSNSIIKQVDVIIGMGGGGSQSTTITQTYMLNDVTEVPSWQDFSYNGGGVALKGIAEGQAMLPPEGCMKKCAKPQPPAIPDPPADSCSSSPPTPPAGCQCPPSLEYCSEVDWPINSVLDASFQDDFVKSAVEMTVQTWSLLGPVGDQCQAQLKAFMCAFYFQRCSAGTMLQVPCAGMAPGGGCGSCPGMPSGIAFPAADAQCTVYGQLACDSSDVSESTTTAGLDNDGGGDGGGGGGGGGGSIVGIVIGVIGAIASVGVLFALFSRHSKLKRSAAAHASFSSPGAATNPLAES